MKRSIYSKSKSIEKQEIGVLKLILSDKVIEKLTSGDDTYPDTDGHLQLLNKKRETTGLNLEVQIKPIYYKKGKIPFFKCSSKLLAYASSSNLPLLFISVDINDQVAYWHYISKELVSNIFTEENVPKEKTLYFNKKNIIKKGDESYLKEWKIICNHHINKTNDRLIASLLSEQLNIMHLSSDVLIEKIKILTKIAHYRSVKGEYLVVPQILLLGQNLLSNAVTSELNESVYKEYFVALDAIKYYEPGEVFKMFLSFLNLEALKSVHQIISEKLKNLSSYNYHILIAFGHLPQLQIIDVLTTYSFEDKIKKFNVLKSVYQALLEPSFSGTSMKDDITMVFHRGPLNASPILAKLRRKVLTDLMEMFKLADIPNKLLILEVVMHGTYLTHETAASEILHKSDVMIKSDVRFIIKELEQVITKSKKFITELPILLSLEQKLGWVKLIHGKKVPQVLSLLSKLQNDKGIYSLYRLLIGQSFQLRDGEDYQTTDREWKALIAEQVQTISDKNLNKYLKDLSEVVKMSEFEPLWSLSNLKNFLVDIGRSKPAVAKKLIEKSIQNNLPLSTKLVELVGGIRNSGNRNVLEVVVEFLTNKREPKCVVAIAASFIYLDKGNLDKVSKNDILVLEDIIFKKNKFSLPLYSINNQDFYFILYGVFRVSSLQPQKSKKMFLELLKVYPDQVILNFMAIDFALRDKMFFLDDWSKIELERLANLLVKVSSLEHHSIGLLVELGRVDFEILMDVFYRRMLEKQKSREKFEFSKYYQAVPQHADDLKPIFEKNVDKVKKIVKMWSKKHLGEVSVFSLNLSILLDSLAPSIVQEIIFDLISSGKRKNIDEAIDLLPKFDSIDVDFCLKIVEITDDKKVLNTLMGYLTNVGTVSGVSGENIFAKAWQNKVNSLEVLMRNITSNKCKKFIIDAIKVLREMIINSEKEHQLKLKKRELENKQREEESDI